MKEARGGTGYYLYCLARAGRVPELEAGGVSVASPPFLERIGEFFAVVNEVPLDEFCGPEAESKFQDVSWIGPRALLHEKLVQWVMRFSPVFPARFGTIFSSLTGIHKTVYNNLDIISKFIDTVEFKEEWSVKCYIDIEEVQKRFLERELYRQANHLASLSPGKRYVEQRRLQRSTAREVREWLAHKLLIVETELCHDEIEWTPREVLSRKATGKEMDMLFNLAFLIHKENVGKFAEFVESAERRHEELGLVIETSGPWPPYSFRPGLVEG